MFVQYFLFRQTSSNIGSRFLDHLKTYSHSNGILGYQTLGFLDITLVEGLLLLAPLHFIGKLEILLFLITESLGFHLHFHLRFAHSLSKILREIS